MPPATDDLGIREHNWEAHQDIQDEIAKKRDGLFCFILKVSCGNITDFVVFENDTATTLANGQSDIIVPQVIREESGELSVRINDSQYYVEERSTRLEYA